MTYFIHISRIYTYIYFIGGEWYLMTELWTILFNQTWSIYMYSRQLQFVRFPVLICVTCVVYYQGFTTPETIRFKLWSVTCTSTTLRNEKFWKRYLQDGRSCFNGLKCCPVPLINKWSYQSGYINLIMAHLEASFVHDIVYQLAWIGITMLISPPWPCRAQGTEITPCINWMSTISYINRLC